VSLKVNVTISPIEVIPVTENFGANIYETVVVSNTSAVGWGLKVKDI
jgi:hypothetical protein